MWVIYFLKEKRKKTNAARGISICCNFFNKQESEKKIDNGTTKKYNNYNDLFVCHNVITVQFSMSYLIGLV